MDIKYLNQDLAQERGRFGDQLLAQRVIALMTPATDHFKTFILILAISKGISAGVVLAVTIQGNNDPAPGFFDAHASMAQDWP